MNKETKNLSNESKKAIYSLICKSFKFDVDYPLSKLTSYLKDNNVDYKSFGYTKMKKFLTDLSFVSIVETDDNKPTIKIKKIETKTSKSKNKVSNEAKTNHKQTQQKQNTQAIFFVPDKLLLSIKEITGLGLDDKTIIETIKNNYSNAMKKNLVIAKDDSYTFTLSFKDKQGSNLIGSIKKANPNCDYDYFLNYVGADKDKPKDTFKNDIYFSDFDNAVAELASLAKNEKWCYRNSKDPYVILKIYLQYTYYRLTFQKKILFDKKTGFGAFNTGLVTKDYEDIYCVLLKNSDKRINAKYLFQGFTIAATQGIGKIVVSNFNPLPAKPTYIKYATEAYYDINKELLTDYNHIILDNLSRFPLHFLKMIAASFPNEKKIVSSIEKATNDQQKDRLYYTLKNAISSNSRIYELLKAFFDSILNKSLLMVKDNYRFAIPSYFPTRDAMSMMLPLSFDNKKGPEAVLLVELMPSGNYQGQTILTLKQCYVNARLIAPVDNTFLNANKIDD